MNSKAKLVRMVLLLLIVAVAMSPMANAKGGHRVTLKRPGHHDLKANLGKTQFGRGAATREICAEGACNCDVCVCYGTFECCVVGCVACWDYRDTHGLCAT